jgi:hypothetical protein
MKTSRIFGIKSLIASALASALLVGCAHDPNAPPSDFSHMGSWPCAGCVPPKKARATADKALPLCSSTGLRVHPSGTAPTKCRVQ